MTTLNHLYIVAHDVKATCINFEIQKKLFYPFNFKGKFAKRLLDATHVPLINDALSVIYADSVGEYTVFTGKITKVTPSGAFYTIEATSDMIKLFSGTSTYTWASATNHDAIMEDLLDATAGPGLTVDNNVTTHQSLSWYGVSNASMIDQLRKLVLFSADAAGDPSTVFYQSASDLDGVVLEDMGENVPGTDIVLSHANGTLLSKVTYDDTTQEIVNSVVMDCLHDVETRICNDIGLGTTSVTAYGTRQLKCYRPEVKTQADARIGTDTILRMYSAQRTRLKADVKHSQLDGRNYPVLNTLYTVIDASTSTTYTDVNCIEHNLRWPSFRDTCVFGSVFMNTGDYFLSNQGNSNYVENSAAAKSYRFNAYVSATTQEVGTAYEDVIFDTVTENLRVQYNNATGIYTVPFDGYYTFGWFASLSTIPDGASVTVAFFRDSTEKVTTVKQNGSGIAATIGVSGTFSDYFTAGETAHVMIKNNDAVHHHMANGTPIHFSGKKI